MPRGQTMIEHRIFEGSRAADGGTHGRPGLGHCFHVLEGRVVRCCMCERIIAPHEWVAGTYSKMCAERVPEAS